MAVEVKILKALQGDCIWIRYGEEKYTNIVIDSGPKEFKEEFKALISKIQSNGENIDLLVFTHIDNDHIGGACEVLGDKEIKCDCIKKIWINTATKICENFSLREYINSDYKINVNNINQMYTPIVANDLIDVIIRRNIEVEQLIMIDDKDMKLGDVDDKKINLGDAEILILSPTKKELEDLIKEWGKDELNTPFSKESWNEVAIDTINEHDKFIKDTNKFNGSSIAFIFKYNDVLLVLLGDAYSHIIANTMEHYYKGIKLEVDLIKLPHHGSSSNTNYDLLDKFICSNYVISTNGANNNPDKRTIARLIKANDKKKINLYSNYNWWKDRNYFTQSDQLNYIRNGIINQVELSSDMIEIKEGLLIGNE